MEALSLDPGSYDGTYKLVGDEISFDLINTISWKGTEREHDWLDRPKNFIDWAVAVGLIDTRKARVFKRRSMADLAKAMEMVRTIRNDLFNVLFPLAVKEKPSRKAMIKFEAWIQRIVRHRHIDISSYQWIWNDPCSFAEILFPVIWNASHIITGVDHSRIRNCPACNWIFYDRTRNRSRRWCDMEDCGSRDKSLRYYHRQND
jgi:predicted RNA-binding Zn ribbon-like protein